MTRNAQGKELICSYLDAVSTLDVDAVAPLFHEDGVVDIPYAPEGIPRTLPGRDAIDDFYQALPNMATAMNFANYKISALETEGEFVAEYTSDATMKDTGAPYRNTYVALVTVRDGKIARFAEYFDPIPLVEALGGRVTTPAGAA